MNEENCPFCGVEYGCTYEQAVLAPALYCQTELCQVYEMPTTLIEGMLAARLIRLNQASTNLVKVFFASVKRGLRM